MLVNVSAGTFMLLRRSLACWRCPVFAHSLAWLASLHFLPWLLHFLPWRLHLPCGLLLHRRVSILLRYCRLLRGRMCLRALLHCVLAIWRALAKLLCAYWAVFALLRDDLPLALWRF